MRGRHRVARNKERKKSHVTSRPTRLVFVFFLRTIVDAEISGRVPGSRVRETRFALQLVLAVNEQIKLSRGERVPVGRAHTDQANQTALKVVKSAQKVLLKGSQ
ncbi:hypothetical protein BC940DRAFT_313968 [Gongronella butleri]|nr:hypothetical protein BC940DRAFT_313968 [Gongronella butleri]